MKEKLEQLQKFIDKLNIVDRRICIIFSKLTSEILYIFDMSSLIPAEGTATEFSIKGIEVTKLINNLSLFENQSNQVFLSEYEIQKSGLKQTEMRFEKDAFTYIIFLK